MKARFILDLDSDTWATIHSALVTQAYYSSENLENIKLSIESLEKQALSNDLMTENDLLEWRSEIVKVLKNGK